MKLAWNSKEGRKEEITETRMVNSRGCQVLLAEPVVEGAKVVVVNLETLQARAGQVVWRGLRQANGKTQVAIGFEDSDLDFWGKRFTDFVFQMSHEPEPEPPPPPPKTSPRFPEAWIQRLNALINTVRRLPGYTEVFASVEIPRLLGQPPVMRLELRGQVEIAPLEPKALEHMMQTGYQGAVVLEIKQAFARVVKAAQRRKAR